MEKMCLGNMVSARVGYKEDTMTRCYISIVHLAITLCTCY